jgi:hypothetical protein
MTQCRKLVGVEVELGCVYTFLKNFFVKNLVKWDIVYIFVETKINKNENL